MKFGVCAEIDDAPALAEAGFDFIELHVTRDLKTADGEEAFAESLARIKASALRCLAANCFVPGSLKITGPDADPGRLIDHAALVCRRAAEAGLETIVLGSGGARDIPKGFDRDLAYRQLVDFGVMLGPVAAQHGVTIAVEPLCRSDSNIFTTVGECAAYVRELAHTHIRLLVDAYHWGRDGDSYDDIVDAAPLLHHVHVATYPARRPPGADRCDLSVFFAALGESGYDGPVSVEARWDDLAAQAPRAREELGWLAESARLRV